MKLLSEEQLDAYLRQYYEEHFGVRDTDIWYKSPAVNARIFQRDDQWISLVSHIITGEVKASITKLSNDEEEG